MNLNYSTTEALATGAKSTATSQIPASLHKISTKSYLITLMSNTKDITHATNTSRRHTDSSAHQEDKEKTNKVSEEFMKPCGRTNVSL